MVIGFDNWSISAPLGWNGQKLVVKKDTVIDKKIFSRGKIVLIVYETKNDNVYSIYNSVSLDNGENFLNTVEIQKTEKKQNYLYNPHAAVSSTGIIYIMWQEMGQDSKMVLMFSISADYGATWSKPDTVKVNSVNNMVPYSFYDYKDNLHIFFHSSDNEVFKLIHAISSNGHKFDEASDVTSFNGDIRGSFSPSIVFSKNNIFIAYQAKSMSNNILTDDIYFIKSADNGINWSKLVRITESTSNDVSPSIVINNDTIYCVYSNNENNNWELLLLKGEQGGSIWTKPVKVLNTNTNCFYPSITSISDKIYIFWYDNREGLYKINAKQFDIKENKFYKEVILSENSVPAVKPSAVYSSNSIICSWIEDGSIFIKKTDNSAAPPELTSSTHPAGQWSEFSDAEVAWDNVKDDSEVSGYAVVVNREKNYDPAIVNVAPSVTNYKIPFLEDGVTYFHIRTVDKAGNMSRTVHYPLMVSKNPLPIPNIVSDTHPEGKGIDDRDVSLTWDIDNIERLKGFEYSLTKNSSAVPEKFTDKNDINFKKLDDGRYFFSLRAVDKTGNPGRIATYEIIVGKADNLDNSVYSQIASQEKQVTDEKKDANAAVVTALINKPLKKIVEIDEPATTVNNEDIPKDDNINSEIKIPVVDVYSSVFTSKLNNLLTKVNDKIYITLFSVLFIVINSFLGLGSVKAIFFVKRINFRIKSAFQLILS